MSSQKLNILLVDDDPVLLDLHRAFLEKDDYTVLHAQDGQSALDILDIYHDNIGVIVSDISMPNVDGYDLCKRVKQEERTKNIPVIFVSAHTGLEEKIKGFDVGADDYIEKPVDEKVLSKKIFILLDMHEKQISLSKQAADSQNMAMQAISYSSELGQVIDLFQNVINAVDYNEVANCFFSAVSDYELVSIIQFYTPSKVLNQTEAGIVSPLEANVLELARDKGRFFDFGARTIVNYRTFSILVKNMPINDPEKYGRLKDVLGMIGNGIEAKVVQLNNDFMLKEKDSLIESVSDSIREIENLFGSVQKDSIAAVEDMNDRLTTAIDTLGLTEDQENYIQKITGKCLESSSKAFYRGVQIGENLKNISRKVQYIVGRK